MPDLVRIQRAILSVSDKSDLVPFAKALEARGVEIISTGGTAKALLAAGVKVTPVEKITNFPEGLDGRVKTLHPAVHGGLLAVRDNPEHQAFLKAHQIRPIDLVCINLYPFQKTVSDPNVRLDEAIENIDVGGPAMLRAAAKNFDYVTVVTSPNDYDRVINELSTQDNCTSWRLRAELAAATFARTAEYDAAIASFLSRRSPAAFPQVLNLRYTLVDVLRYGENPHQEAALYRDPASTGQTVVNARQLHGKQLSYNNILDAAAALEAVKDLDRLTRPLPASGDGSAADVGLHQLIPPLGAVVVKHTNPCGGALAGDGPTAVGMAVAGDPVAAYGGILSLNFRVDGVTARVIADPAHFFEVVVAPSFDEAALEVLKERWANVRLLEVGNGSPSAARKLDYRSVPGGMLVQDRNIRRVDPRLWQHVAGPKPSADQILAASTLESLGRFVSSNAIVVGGIDRSAAGGKVVRLFGVGSGQVDRVSACRLAVAKAGAKARGAVAVGDAFFPFPDGPGVLIDAGISMIVHPGGSKRDAETVDLCNQRGVTCMLSGARHFRH